MYKILDHEKKTHGELTIMFSVPYDYNKYQNCIGLGIYKNNTPCDDELFNEMYYYTGPFAAGKATGSNIAHYGEGFCVKGTMSEGGKAVMKVEFE